MLKKFIKLWSFFNKNKPLCFLEGHIGGEATLNA